MTPQSKKGGGGLENEWHAHYAALQCVAVCCRVLQCVAVCCSVLPCVAVCGPVLQHVVLCCGVL